MRHEPFRPGYHFTARRNWLNDPNGLVWYDGEYHLFYQHNPSGTDWGNMSWGHAVSPDLVTWHELPVAIPFTDAEHVFSGSVVVDRQDTAGFAVDGVPAMVAIYTAADPVTGRQTQALAHSGDRGRTWTRYVGNPVLDIESTEFRDPKVFWYEPGGYWVMVVALPVEHAVRLYRSEDLKSWHHLSDFGPAGATGGIWECPDLFELPVDGDPDDTRWVLVVSLSPGGPTGGSGAQYFVGHFDGKEFTADDLTPDGGTDPGSWLDHGADHYAAVSFTDTPDGERVLIGWMGSWDYAATVPAATFRGAMSVPRVHRLVRLAGRIRLVQQPVPGLAGLRGTTYQVCGLAVDSGVTDLPDHLHGDRLEIRAVLRPETAARLGLHVRVGPDERTVVGYDVERGTVYVDRRESGQVDFHPSFAAVHHAPVAVRDGAVTITVLVDTTSVEVFGGVGECVITDQVFPDSDSRGLAVFAEGGAGAVVELSITRLDGQPEAASPHPQRAHERLV